MSVCHSDLEPSYTSPCKSSIRNAEQRLPNDVANLMESARHQYKLVIKC